MLLLILRFVFSELIVLFKKYDAILTFSEMVYSGLLLEKPEKG